MADNIVRSAIGAALDHPFADEAFALVDLIEANVRDDDPAPESTRHEVAAEITDRLFDVMSTRSLAILWVVLNANGAAVERLGEMDADTTLDAIRLDVWCTVEPAVFAGLEAHATIGGVNHG